MPAYACRDSPAYAGQKGQGAGSQVAHDIGHSCAKMRPIMCAARSPRRAVAPWGSMPEKMYTNTAAQNGDETQEGKGVVYCWEGVHVVWCIVFAE